jgi:hypothetical protein
MRIPSQIIAPNTSAVNVVTCSVDRCIYLTVIFADFPVTEIYMWNKAGGRKHGLNVRSIRSLPIYMHFPLKMWQTLTN